MPRLFLACALCCASLCGCAPTRQVISRVPEPGATVTEIRALSFDHTHAELAVQMEIENPGAALSLVFANFEILAQGRPFAVGTSSISLAVPAGGRASFVLPVQLAYLDLPVQARQRVNKGASVQVVARGTLRGTCGTEAAAVEFDGQTDLALVNEGELP